ncbi:MAG: hypothetical protein R2912_01025 [Eubacteriales bacterium]
MQSYDMTSERAWPSSAWALAHAETSADVRRIMLTNYCGEISLPHGKQAPRLNGCLI